MNIDKWLTLNTKDLTGANVVITGATGGLGENIVEILARLNANIFTISRSEKKSKSLKEKILFTYPNTNYTEIIADLESDEQVSNCIDVLKTNNIDILILNAGIYNVPLKKLNNGFNNVFQVNFLSQYRITKELLPTLRQSKYGKVIAVSSIAHNYSKINVEDVDFSHAKKASKIYGNSKRFLTYALHELIKEDTVKLSIVHPGITLTNMTNHYPKYINWLVKFGISVLFPTPKKATLNIIKGIFSSTPYLTWIGPSICNIWGKPKLKSLKTARPEEIKKIFEIAQNIIK